MPSSCGFSWTDEIDGIIRDRAAAYGLPLDLAYSFIAGESRFNPYIAGDDVGVGYPGFNDNPEFAIEVVGSDGHRGLRWPNAPADKNQYIAWEGYGKPNQYFWSHGLLQLMTGGGQGSPAPNQSLPWSTLVNPWLNLNIGYPHIAAAFRQCWSPSISQFDYIHCIMRNSGHPGPITNTDSRLLNFFPHWQCFFQVYGGQGGGTVPPPPPIPDPIPPMPDPLPPLPPPPPPYPGDPIDIGMIAAFGIFVLGVVAVSRPNILKKKFVLPDPRKLGGYDKAL